MSHLHLTILTSLFAVSAYAQTPAIDIPQDTAQAKGLFSRTPVFPKFIKDKSRLADNFKNLNFESAITSLQKEITALKRKRKPIDELESQLERAEDALTRLKGTDRVTILDSVVVKKSDFLSAYKNLTELGTITFSDNNETAAFTSQLGTRLIRSERTDGGLQLFSYYLDGDNLTERTHLNTLDVDGDLNYPFLQADGQTFYFAARSEEGCGNYDLYATRYDAESGRFYRAENMGYPFNSYANDYMMVVDDQNQLGWFASDRYQPEDMVCVYLFIPKDSRHPFDYENTDPHVVIAAASLRSIRTTWDESNKQERIEARQRLSLIEDNVDVVSNHEFSLVINDSFTYHNYSDFQNKEAQSLCRKWVASQKQLASLESQLSDLRRGYSKTNQRNRQQIIDLEQQVESLIEANQNLEKQIRNTELSRK